MSGGGTTILDVGVRLPDTVETTEALQEAHPDWNVAEAMKHTGVVQRHLAAPGETALDLAEAAAHALMARQRGLAERIDLLVSCTQTPDLPLPGNATLLHGRLGLPSRVGAFDLGLACSGFTTALSVVHGLIRGGLCRSALIVTADTYSRLCSPLDRATRLLFGDGAAATLVGAGPEGSGVIDCCWSSDGGRALAFHVPAGGMRRPSRDDDLMSNDGPNQRAPSHIHMNGKAMLQFTAGVIPEHVRGLLERNGLGLDDIDHFLFHQASALVLDSLRSRLRIPEARMHSNLATTGNTVSASIPILLHDLAAQGAIQRGETALLCGFGAGLSWCSVLLRY